MTLNYVSMNILLKLLPELYNVSNCCFVLLFPGNVLILTKAYIIYVRPLLEYCTYLWSPYQHYLIDKIERVQRYFSRRVLFRSNLPYHTRLDVLKLETLEMRRIKFDLKLCYKIINGLCDLNFDKLFIFAPSAATRGHNFKLIKPHCKTIGYSIFIPPELCNIGTHCPQMWSMLHHLLSLLEN